MLQGPFAYGTDKQVEKSGFHGQFRGKGGAGSSASSAVECRKNSAIRTSTERRRADWLTNWTPTRMALKSRSRPSGLGTWSRRQRMMTKPEMTDNTAFSTNTNCVPALAISAPATSGPTMRDAFMEMPFKANAAGSCERGTVGERIGDTFLGALLAWSFSYVLPLWEKKSVPEAIARVLRELRDYAKHSLRAGSGDAVEERMARNDERTVQAEPPRIGADAAAHGPSLPFARYALANAHYRGDRAAEALEAIDALAEAAGVPTVIAAVEGSVRRAGRAATGWPPVRWTAGLRADPLRRLHLTGAPRERGRTSLAAASGASTARVSMALRQVRQVAGDELSPGWRDSLRRELDAREQALPERLDRAVAGTDLQTDLVPSWWSLAALGQRALLVVAAVGALWLLALAVLGALQLDAALPLPHVGVLPLPTALLFGGLLAGLLLAAGCQPFVAQTAARRKRQALATLLERVRDVAQAELLGPLAAQRAAHERFRIGVQRAAT